jgi:hypothetical protein
MDRENRIPLSEMLAELRKELLRAQDEGGDSALKFQIEDIEIELHVATTKGAGGGVGVKFWVYNADAKANVSEAKTQRLKLKLKPVNAADDTPFKAGGKAERGD